MHVQKRIAKIEFKIIAVYIFLLQRTQPATNTLMQYMMRIQEIKNHKLKKAMGPWFKDNIR